MLSEISEEFRKLGIHGMSQEPYVWHPHRLRGQFGIDNDVRINFDRLRRLRTERAIKCMKEHGLGALLCYTQSKIRYITSTYHFGSKGDALLLYRYCLLTEDGPVLFETVGTDLICTKNAAPWLTDIRPSIVYKTGAGPAKEMMVKKFARNIKEVLEEYGVAKEKLGVDEVGSYVAYKALENEGIEVADGTPALDNAVLIKFPEELEILKQGCAITDAAFQTVRDVLRPGIKECEVAGAISNTLYSLGSEKWVHMTFASGGETNPFRRWGPTDKMIRFGDLVIIDIIQCYQGYWTCVYRTFVCGGKRAATEEKKEAHRQSYDSMYAAIDKIRPGVTTAEIAETWRELEFYAADKEFKTVSLLNFGHGLGTSDHEMPYITMAYSPEYPVEIKKNMYLAIETYSGRPGGRWGARLEENFVVTDNGVEIFSLDPYDEALME